MNNAYSHTALKLHGKKKEERKKETYKKSIICLTLITIARDDYYSSVGKADAGWYSMYLKSLNIN